MNKKGFLFIEILVGLAILGLVSTTGLPILNISLKNFTRIKDNSEMYYMGEMVIERFKSKDEYILKLINELETSDSVIYLDDNIDSEKYNCEIIKIRNNAKLLEYMVRISKVNQEKNSYVEYKASIPKT